MVGPVVDLGAEKRVWHGDMFFSEEYEEDEGGGRKQLGKVVGRWAREVVIVGEMRFEGVGVGPTFDRGESKQGRLACDVSLVDPLCSLVRLVRRSFRSLNQHL